MIQKNENQKHPYMGCYLFTKVAAMYFNTYTRADACKRCFIEKIEEDKELYEKLKATGFAVINKYITPKQMDLIIEYWGAPYAM